MTDRERIQAAVDREFCETIKDEGNRMLAQGYSIEQMVGVFRSIAPKLGMVRQRMLDRAPAHAGVQVEPPSSSIEKELSELRVRVSALEGRQP